MTSKKPGPGIVFEKSMRRLKALISPMLLEPNIKINTKASTTIHIFFNLFSFRKFNIKRIFPCQRSNHSQRDQYYNCRYVNSRYTTKAYITFCVLLQNRTRLKAPLHSLHFRQIFDMKTWNFCIKKFGTVWLSLHIGSLNVSLFKNDEYLFGFWQNCEFRSKSEEKLFRTLSARWKEPVNLNTHCLYCNTCVPMVGRQ